MNIHIQMKKHLTWCTLWSSYSQSLDTIETLNLLRYASENNQVHG